jgi:tripartite-type tricarboxylate transporter receptor subunit TctC
VLNPTLPANNLREMVTYAKANPGKLNFGSASSGTTSHFAAELFKRAAGIDIQIIHYKGAAPATLALLAGDLQAMFNNPVSAMPLVKSGKVRALVTTGLKRSPTAPDVPTISESGYPGFKTDTWFAVLGPAGMPAELTSKISRDIGTVLKMPDVRQRLDAQGLEAMSSTPDQLAAIMRADYDTYTAVILESKIKAE